MSLNGKLESEYVLSGKLSKLETINGLSAYELAVLHGFKGTEEEWLASLVPDDIKFVPEKAENEAYADAMAYNVASYFCNMIPEATDCVTGNPAQQKTFVPVYKDKEAVLYTNLLRYDAVIDNQSTFGHYAPAGTETTQPDNESGAGADAETDVETDIDSDPESGVGEQSQRGITQKDNHDVLNVGGTNYPIMYMTCSNFLMLLTKNRAYENSPWYKLFADKDATPKQLAALCLERGDTNETPWTFDCLNVAVSWRIAEVMKSSGCTPFFVANKSEDGVVTWDSAGVDKMRDGDIMFAGKPQYPGRYKGIYHCMMYFRTLDRINAAAKAWGADVELRGFDEARNMGFSGKYGYVVHCGGGTDSDDTDTYGVKIKNVIRIETMERFMANTGKGVTVWGARAAANALNSTKLHQGVTGRMVLYDCVLVSSYRHNTNDKDNKTISYQYVESMRSGKDRNNGVFSYGQYRYSQLRSPVTTKEVDGNTVKTLNFNDFVGSKKSGTYCVWTSDVYLENGPTEDNIENVAEGSSLLANPTKKLFMLEVKCVSVSAAYAIQRVTTLTSDTPKVWERTFNYDGEHSKWREICDVTQVHSFVDEFVGKKVQSLEERQTEQETNSEQVKNRVNELEKQIADILYTPISINSFTHNIGTKERGETVTDVKLSWTLNKIPQALKLDSESLALAQTGSKTISGLSITAANAGSVKWTLSAADERNAVATKQSPGFTFLNCVYYGAAAQPNAVDSAFIKSLTTKTSPTSTKTRTITVNGGGKYIWYCLPVGLGKCTFTNNGFPAGIELVDTISFTNALGYTENYYVYRSNQLITDSVTIGVS